MRTEPMMAYYCECCGRKFTNPSECREHEDECMSRKICPLCGGRGTIFCGYTLGQYLGFGAYEKVRESKTCHECGGRGWIYE